MENDVADWLVLLRASTLGPARIQKLLQAFTSPAEVLAAARQGELDGICSGKALHDLKHPDWRAIERDLEWSRHPDQTIYTWNDPRYPERLRQIAPAPLVLFCRGDPNVLSFANLIAVVGSRNPSPSGRENAKQFSRQLSAGGFVVVSGLAVGIDSAAHMGSLAAGKPGVAVLAHGLDRIYPNCNKTLAKELLDQGGVLVSEMGLGVAPIPGFFPRRNRIISGLSLGVVVVEAAKRSGALNTARHALEQGREVFAVPGAIHNPLAKGCHDLIREGAKCVDEVQHIVEELPCIQSSYLFDKNRKIKEQKPTVQHELLNFIGYDPVSADLIIQNCGKPAETVSSQLTELELQGVISVLPGGKFIRV